jgi:Holliday junction resolvase
VAESSFQSKVKKHLKDEGCYVLVLSSGPGIPDGMTDVLALCPSGRFIALECKASSTSGYRPLQKLTISKLNKMGYAKATYPENWEEIKKELQQII